MLEVSPPKGYRALDGTLLEFVIKTIDPKGEIITKDGKYYDKETGIQVDKDHNVIDPKTGKIIEGANGYITITYTKKGNYVEPEVKNNDDSKALIDYVTSATA